MLTKNDLEQIKNLLDDGFQKNNKIIIKKIDDAVDTLAGIIKETLSKEVDEVKVTNKVYSQKIEFLESDMTKVKKALVIA